MFRKGIAVLLCFVLAGLCLGAVFAVAEDSSRVIRVGWYESPFNRMDAFGRRTGYAYDYQRKIAAYTGWKYEYVEGSWPELMALLREGRIDMMSDVSYTEDRKDEMLFTSLPMGSEQYYLYISPGAGQISREDFSSLNGKKVGVTQGSVQRDLMLAWAQSRGLEVELEELSCTDEESLKLLKEGALDALVTLDSYGEPEKVVPVWKIGASDFYFVVSNSRPDLLSELDTALSRIQEENRNYHEQLTALYMHNSEANRYLTVEEKEWLDDHGPIRVGYQNSYLAFCAADPATGELTGALKDYLALAEDALGNAQPTFEAVCYPTAAAAMEALQAGEVDCMFPANLTANDGENAGVVMTPALMSTEMDAVVRREDRQDFLRRTQVRVGVNRGNPNYEIFLLDHYPTWTPVFYTDTPACLDAVAARDADCIIISNYRYGNIREQCEKLNLTTIYTGVDMDYSFAVREGNTVLYSILSRIISQVPDATVNAALTYYSAAPEKTGLAARLETGLPLALGIACIVLLALTGVMFFRLQKLRKAVNPTPGQTAQGSKT